MANKKKGAAVKGADMAVPAEKLDYIQDTEGAAKMGYTQNFGPARKSGYAKGAAKVNQIMGRGPAQSVLTADQIAKLKVGVDSGGRSEEYKAARVGGTTALIDSLNLVQAGEGGKAKERYGNRFSGKGYDFNKLSDETKQHVQSLIDQGGFSAQDVQNIIKKSQDQSKPADTMDLDFG